MSIENPIMKEGSGIKRLELLKSKDNIEKAIPPKTESVDEKNKKISAVREEIYNFFYSVKKVAATVAIGAIGLIPIESDAQLKPENNIENNDKLKISIFNEVENACKNGTLKNTQQYPYFFRLEKDGYDITYDFDFNYDGIKDKNPAIEIDYTDGNSHYILKDDPNTEDQKDIVYNYKDNSLSDSETKTYEEFFSENMVVVPSLYGKKDHLVHFRKINKEEMTKFLEDIKKYSAVIDSVGIAENNKNIQQKMKNEETQK